MLRVLWNTVCWRRAPRIGQTCLLPQSALFATSLLPQSALFANINPPPLEGHAHASKSSQVTQLASQARWSRSRCSFPDRTSRLPSRRSQRPRVYLYDSSYVIPRLDEFIFFSVSQFLLQVLSRSFAPLPPSLDFSSFFPHPGRGIFPSLLWFTTKRVLKDFR